MKDKRQVQWCIGLIYSTVGRIIPYVATFSVRCQSGAVKFFGSNRSECTMWTGGLTPDPHIWSDTEFLGNLFKVRVAVPQGTLDSLIAESFLNIKRLLTPKINIGNKVISCRSIQIINKLYIQPSIPGPRSLRFLL